MPTAPAAPIPIPLATKPAVRTAMARRASAPRRES